MEEIRTSTTTQSPSGVVRREEVSQTKKTSHNGLVLGIIALLILILLVFWLSKSSDDMQGPDTTSTEIAPGQVLTEAPDGAIISGFPRELILEGDVTAQESYSIAYTDGNLSQPVVSYLSVRTLSENIAAYGAYLVLNGWNITHAAAVTEAPAFFYAYKDNAEVNITFAEGTDGVMVTIAHVTRGE